eukprot:gene2182-2382_t
MISEAVALLQDMFIDRHLYSQQDWDKLREDLRKSTNPVEGLKQLGTRLHDPYFRVISKESLTSDQIRTRGLAVSLQISLERRLSTQFLTHGLKRLFLPSSWLRLLTATPNYLALSASFWPLSKSGPRWLPALAGWSFLTYHLLPYIFPAQIVAHGPAGKSEGVKEGDVLLAVNRQGLPALTAAALQRWMDRGELGEVSLRVIRKNGDHWDEKEVKALRQLINESRVSFSSLPAQHGRGAGYLKINEFSTNCLDDCCEALHDLDQEIQKSHGCGLQALAIDLRDNRGGALSAALQLASLFTPHRAILQQVKVKDRIVTVRNTRHLSSPYERQGWIQEMRLQAHHWLTSCHLLPPPATTGLYNHIPLLILVNYQTASASEIFLEACLHSHPSSVLTVGSRTLGKNKAQALVSLSDGTGLCFSICEFLSPSGRSMAAGHLPQGLYSDPDNHFALIVPDQWTVLARKNPPPNFGRYRAEDILLTAVNVAEGASLGVTRSDAHDLLRDLDIDWWFAPFNTLSDVGSPELIANWLIIQRQGEFEARRTSSEVVKATFSSSSTTTPQGRAFLDFEFITPLVKGSKRRTLARAFLQGDSLVVVWLSTLNDKKAFETPSC